MAGPLVVASCTSIQPSTELNQTDFQGARTLIKSTNDSLYQNVKLDLNKQIIINHIQ
jgi:hypothetical protein